MSTEIPERDGDGYLKAMDDWTPRKLARQWLMSTGLSWTMLSGNRS